MSSRMDLKFFTTAAHPCSYLEQREAVTLFADPDAEMSMCTYSHLSAKGFRRSGNYVYRPQCHGCNACISVRVPVAQFQPTRSQRRTLSTNADLTVRAGLGRWSEAHYALYASYISNRHADGDMYPPTPRQYREFLISDWSDTEFLEFRIGDRLLAVAVTDVLQDGLSAVYTFYEPNEHWRGLGTLAILRQIEACQKRGLPYLYLGYWVRQAPRMHYKTRFRPLEMLIEGEWLLAR